MQYDTAGHNLYLYFLLIAIDLSRLYQMIIQWLFNFGQKICNADSQWYTLYQTVNGINLPAVATRRILIIIIPSILTL